MASAVVAPSTLRQSGNRRGRARYSQMKAPAVTTKWAVP